MSFLPALQGIVQCELCLFVIRLVDNTVHLKMEYKASPIQSKIPVLVLAGIRIYDYLPSSSGSGHDGKWHESRAVL